MTTLKPGDRTKCPHCQTVVMFESPSAPTWNGSVVIMNSPKYKLISTHSLCPSCLKFVVAIDEMSINANGPNPVSLVEKSVWPITSSKDPVPAEVPNHIAQDYTEAALVLSISPKASAALSRRCLQGVLREEGKTKAKDLADQINEVLPNLPTRIADNLDAVRVIGNFAAHPMKSQTTGIIVEVEVGEAGWNLDVLDALFDYYYVRPALEQKKREALNEKLKDAGKPTLN